jgi:hypothetical protein
MAIPCVNELQEGSADQVSRTVAEYPFHGRGGIENRSIRTDDQEEIGGVLPERAGATLADGGLGGASLRPEDPHQEDDHEQPGEEREHRLAPGLGIRPRGLRAQAVADACRKWGEQVEVRSRSALGQRPCVTVAGALRGYLPADSGGGDQRPLREQGRLGVARSLVL